MKKITLLLTLLLNILIFGQPVLNLSDINPLNITITAYNSSSNTLNAGTTGANQTWDYSSLVLSNPEDSTINSTATAPNSSSFSNPNFFIRIDSNGFTDYNYYNITLNKLEVMGASNDSGVYINYTDPETVFIFPFSYNQSVNDTYKTNSPNSVIRSKTITYDAFGTLTTQFGTFTNVIRLKQQYISTTNYLYFKVNPYQDLLSVSINTNGDGINDFIVYENSFLAIEKNKIEQKFSISPNPTNGFLTIQNINFKENEIFINVYDVLGNQIINNDKIESNSKNINLSDFANGLYLIKISNKNNSILYSDKIIKN